MGRRQVGDEDERHAGVGRQRAQQLSKRLEAPADAPTQTTGNGSAGCWNDVVDGFPARHRTTRQGVSAPARLPYCVIVP